MVDEPELLAITLWFRGQQEDSGRKQGAKQGARLCIIQYRPSVHGVLRGQFPAKTQHKLHYLIVVSVFLVRLNQLHEGNVPFAQRQVKLGRCTLVLLTSWRRTQGPVRSLDGSPACETVPFVHDQFRLFCSSTSLTYCCLRWHPSSDPGTSIVASSARFNSPDSLVPSRKAVVPR